MSSKLPIGVATIERPLNILLILYLFIFIISCTPVNLSKQVPKKTQENNISEKIVTTKSKSEAIEIKDDKQDIEDKVLDDVHLDKTIIVLFATDDDSKTTKQFLNTFELGIYNLGVENVDLRVEFFGSDKDLKKNYRKQSFFRPYFSGANSIEVYKNFK